MLDSYQQITLPVTFCILASEALHVLLVPTWDYCQPFLKINSLRKFRLALINEHYRYFSRWWIFHLVLLSDLIVVLFTAWYDYQVLFLIFCSNEFNWCFILFYFFFSSYYLSVCQLSSSVTTSHTEVRTWYESFLVTQWYCFLNNTVKYDSWSRLSYTLHAKLGVCI